MARSTVVLFRGESNFGNIGSMVTALADGFGRLSFDPVIVDIFKDGYENRLMEIIRSRKIIAFISVSGFGLLSQASDMPSAIVGLLADKDRLRVMAASGQQRFSSAHTWTHRARSLAQIVEILPMAA